MSRLNEMRRKLLNWRVNWEIFQRIFPHLNKKADNGYPFDTDNTMTRLHIRNNLELGLNVNRLREVAGQLPKAYGEAFSYVAFRDLNDRIKAYIEIAEERVHPESVNPRLVANKA